MGSPQPKQRHDERPQRDQPRTLFLDAGGVLVTPNWERVAETLDRFGIHASASALRAAEPHVRRSMDAPAPLPVSDHRRGWLYFNGVLDGASVPQGEAREKAMEDLRAYHQEHNLWDSVAADAKKALGRLKGAGLRLTVVSNANGTARAVFTRVGLAPFFHTIIDSHEEGVEKPNPRLFAIALERSGADAATTLHVGDLYHVDIVGARAAGIEAWLFDVGSLYDGVDCPRVASLTELAERLVG